MGAQFSDVGTLYGAPMGRSAYGIMENVDGRVRLFKVKLHQGYDDGGAYWGSSYDGNSLYCATASEDGDDYRQFVRATSREAARAALSIPSSKLYRGTKRKSVSTVEEEPCC